MAAPNKFFATADFDRFESHPPLIRFESRRRPASLVAHANEASPRADEACAARLLAPGLGRGQVSEYGFRFRRGAWNDARGSFTMIASNVFANVAYRLPDEQIVELLSAPNIRIERIVSTGHA